MIIITTNMHKPLVDGFQKLHNLSIEEVKENFQYAGDDSEGGKRDTIFYLVNKKSFSRTL